MLGLIVVIPKETLFLVIASLITFWLLVMTVWSLMSLAAWVVRLAAPAGPPEDHRMALNDNYGLRD